MKSSRTAVILCESDERRRDLGIIAHACGCQIVETDWQLGKRAVASNQPAADFLIVELFSISDELEQSLSELARYLRKNAGQVILWTDMDLLGQVYAALPVDRSHFLVDANDVDAIPVLAGMLGGMAANRLYDRGHGEEYGALHRISDELAQFAHTLAKIAESEKAGLAVKPVSFRPAPPDAFRELVTGTTGFEPKLTATSIREIIKLRRLRDSYFDASLFADPAWDILLDLMAARLEGVQVSVSSLCIAAAVPATTALRWIGTMTESGLLVRQHDPDDARRVFIGLSDGTAANLHQYLVEVQRRSSLAV